METRQSTSFKDFKSYDTQRIRDEYLIQGLFKSDEINMVYSHIDRIIIGGVCPEKPLSLKAGQEIKADFFLQRREMGVINIGSKGIVTIDGKKFALDTNDGLYIGMGGKEIIFTSDDPQNPAKFYFNSAPAHQAYPQKKIEISKAQPQHLGSPAESNERTIYKYVHPDVVKSCQLLMGMTILDPNNMWNTMPCHTHERRMEVYFYFNMSPDSVVFHYMGKPNETRHIVIRNEEAVISPSWSIHSGVGTKNYTFIWGMVGENQTFSDMDTVEMTNLK